MVDYDKAVATVQDPNADPVLLAKIAYENPEFGANVAVNPRCYPGLKRWLATFGDERARQTLAQMGVTAEDGPVADAQPAQDVAADSAAADQYSADSYSADQYSADSYAASAAQQQPAPGPVRGGAVRGAAGAPSHQSIRVHGSDGAGDHRSGAHRQDRAVRARNCAPASRATPAPTRHWSTGSPS